MSDSAYQAVLEEVLTAAIDAARQAAKTADEDAFESGRLMAYYDLITVAKEQAELMGIEFADKTLAEFNPDQELLRGRKPTTA